MMRFLDALVHLMPVLFGAAAICALAYAWVTYVPEGDSDAR